MYVIGSGAAVTPEFGENVITPVVVLTVHTPVGIVTDVTGLPVVGSTKRTVVGSTVSPPVSFVTGFTLTGEPENVAVSFTALGT